LQRIVAEILSGAQLFSASIDAPISVKGSITRRIGRFESDWSPLKTESKFCPAKTPASSRIVVPLLPQSKSFPVLKTVFADAFDENRRVFVLYLDAQILQSISSRSAVGARREIFNSRRAFRQCEKNRGAVRD
jgi:hypothetical protein